MVDPNIYLSLDADEVIAKTEAEIAIETAIDALSAWCIGEASTGDLLGRLVGAGIYAGRAHMRGWPFLDDRRGNS